MARRGRDEEERAVGFVSRWVCLGQGGGKKARERARREGEAVQIAVSLWSLSETLCASEFWMRGVWPIRGREGRGTGDSRDIAAK